MVGLWNTFLLICKPIYPTQNDVQRRFSHIAICMMSQGCTRDWKTKWVFYALDFLPSPRCHTLKKNPGNTPVLFLSYPLISSRLLSCQLLSSAHIFLPVLISSPILSSPPISSSGFLSSHLSSSHLLFSSFIFVSSCPLTSPLILLSALLFIRLQWYVAFTPSLLQRTAE